MTIIILVPDVTTVHPDVGFTARFARDAEDAEMDKFLFSGRRQMCWSDFFLKKSDQ
jgi:hypothetical protein